MFVELQYYFKPMIVNGFSNLTDRTISQVAPWSCARTATLLAPLEATGYTIMRRSPSPPVKAGTADTL